MARAGRAAIFYEDQENEDQWTGWLNETGGSGGAFRTARSYFSFCQTRVTTLILPSLAKGAGRVV